MRHQGAAGPRDLPYPSTFVIDAGGALRAKSENETYRVRPEPATILDALRAATS